ncbi:MAG: ABC transporter substrate-binding protein [bacterium]|nr:ABC transporter substrate-binding protein [bacterium]
MKSDRTNRVSIINVLLIGLLLFCLTGCSMFSSVVEEDPSAEIDSDLVVVGFSQLGSESLWRTANTASIQRALTKENGFFLVFNNARQKQENQIKAIRSFISQRVDYIVFSPVTEDGWETVLLEAKEAGIPVILADRMVNIEDESLYTTWVGTDMQEEGEKAGRWLEEYMQAHQRTDEEDVNIVVLQGTPGATSQIGRTIGFNTIADRHENWNILEQVNGDFTTAKGKEVMQLLLKKYDNIDVVVSQNDDMTFGAIEAIQEASRTVGVNGEITMISFDAAHEALEMVDQGLINVDIECNPEQGDKIAEVISKIEHGEEIEKAYVIEENVFTQKNVKEYLDTRTY